jgi:hypothetical protein
MHLPFELIVEELDRRHVNLKNFANQPLDNPPVSTHPRLHWSAMVLLLNLLLVLSAICANAQTTSRPSVQLDGKAAQVIVDLAGGSIVQFQFKDQRVNPLSWTSGEPAPAHPMGHFVCLDRWGAPSEAERQNGMPFHGEASYVMWNVAEPPNMAGGVIHAEMSAALPLAGLEIKRRMRLLEGAALLRVSESVTNINKRGRVYNMVQHPSIAPPFLDETTLVDANGRKGFMQSSPLPNPEEPSVYWPLALKNGQPVDLRRLIDDDQPDVVSFIIEDDYGWVSASTPGKGLLIGYVWKSSDYPWLDVWRNVQGGRPVARGLEFGTTGLHQPEASLVAKGKIFGHMLYTYIDAGETVTRSYAAFLFKVPSNYQGVERVTYQGGRLILHERGAGPERDLAMTVGNLFP